MLLPLAPPPPFFPRVDCSVFNTSEWKTLASLEGHTAAVTGLRFGVNAASLVSSSLDKTIKVFS